MIKNIILDLDETCVSSVEPSCLDDPTKRATFQRKKGKFVHHVTNHFIIFERPRLQAFLDFLFANFNVSVWTYGSESYGRDVIKRVICPPKSGRKLKHKFFYNECEASRLRTGCFKHLDYFFGLNKNYHKNNTLILDDNENVYTTQENQILRLKPFHFFDARSENDKTLVQIQQYLAQFLED